MLNGPCINAPIGTQLVRPKEVMQRLGLSRSTLYQYVKDGKFPRPFRISERATGWRLEQIEDYVRRRERFSGRSKAMPAEAMTLGRAQNQPFLSTWVNAVTRSTLKPTRRLLLLAISTLVDKGGALINVSQDLLAKRTGLGVATVQRALAECESLGWFERKTTGCRGGMSWRRHVFQIRIPNQQLLG